MRIIFQSFLSAMALIAALSTHAANTEPDAVVSRLQTTLLAVMKQADALGYQGRYELLKKEIVASHDLPFIAKTVLGRHWRDLSEEEQARFVETFTRLTLATYADRFDGYSGETFSVEEQKEPMTSGRVLVHSLLTKADGEKVRFDYVLSPKEDTWHIVNIVINGVSDLALKRAEYGAMISKDGIEPLLALLEERIARHANASPSPN